MKTKRYYLLPAAASLFLLSAGPSFAGTTAETTGESTNASRQEQTVDVSQVPQPALDAAQKVLGTKPTDAKVIVGTSPQEYELMAKNKSGKHAKVHVLADGTGMKHGKPHKEAAAPAPTPR